MRDWSSDVCSSDLQPEGARKQKRAGWLRSWVERQPEKSWLAAKQPEGARKQKRASWLLSSQKEPENTWLRFMKVFLCFWGDRISGNLSFCQGFSLFLVELGSNLGIYPFTKVFLCFWGAGISGNLYPFAKVFLCFCFLIWEV